MTALAGPVATPGPTVMRATRPGSFVSMNHIAPSGPAAIPVGKPLALKPGVTPPVNSVTRPSGVFRATRPGGVAWVNQRLPSGPAAIPVGPVFAVEARRHAAGELGDPAVRGDVGHAPRVRPLREPEVAVGPGDDVERVAAGAEPASGRR